MSRIVIALALAGLVVCCTRSVSAQTDSVAAYRPSADSARALDSAYLARRAQLDRWIRAQRAQARPQEDFLSLYAAYGVYLQVLPRDLNQFFSERSLRPDPSSDRDQFGTVDRAFLLSGQAQLGEAWGIYVEYDYLAKWKNTQVDSNAFGQNGAVEELDLTEHSLVVGGTYIVYSSPFYRLRANGGIGGVFALTDETESTTGASRHASATGYQFNFDLLNDFRVSPSISFTLDLLTRSTTTGPLKTSGGQTLDTPFGARGNSTSPTLSIAPTASNLVYGLAAGLVFYF